MTAQKIGDMALEYDVAEFNHNADMLDFLAGNKVDKADGMGLSSCDFTLDEKTKLAGLSDCSFTAGDKAKLDSLSNSAGITGSWTQIFSGTGASAGVSVPRSVVNSYKFITVESKGGESSAFATFPRGRVNFDTDVYFGTYHSGTNNSSSSMRVNIVGDVWKVYGGSTNIIGGVN
ncbi:hypothetical protein FACS1894120_5730 [Clostridia bacterium]|nr:hypothetical protein FACS1894120_5730 [Clostridia bacterium]